MSHSVKALVFVAVASFSIVVIGRLCFESQKLSLTLVTKSAKGVRVQDNTESTNLRNSFFSAPKNDTIYNRMAAMGATRSMDHHRKFLERKTQITAKFNETQRYQPLVDRYAAIAISHDFAFLHIFKCGGTTVVDVTEKPQLRLDDPKIQARQWFGLLRDPIDRMLSAWAECGVRLYEGEINFKGHERYSSLTWLTGEYDFRVRAFLREVKDYLPPTRSCHTHAFPQANFMLNASGQIDDHVRFVGDLSEMRQTLVVAGLSLGPGKLIGRDASEDLVKKYYFPARRDLLSDATILELCDFYAIDYFLFDFDPPSICLGDEGPLAGLL